jgi:predicted nucleic acid-binding protein
MPRGSKLIVDACALIDFFDADISMLAAYAARINSVYVAPDVIDEVFQVEADDVAKHNLAVLEPTLEQYVEAAEPRASLSVADRMCFILARDHSLRIVTNDKTLRNHCERNGVRVVWTLELLIECVHSDLCSAELALAAARTMSESNRAITASLLERMQTALRR